MGWWAVAARSPPEDGLEPAGGCGQSDSLEQKGFRRLDEIEMDAWRSFLAASTSVTARLNRELEAGCGISMHEYEILVRLSEAPDQTLRMSTLAEHVSHSRSRLTHTVRRLENVGYVERASGDSDRRGVNCMLTRAGVDFLREAAPGLRIAVDTSDEPLATLAAERPDSAPDLITPNGEELGQLAGLPAERAMALEEGAVEGSYGPVVDAARLLVGLGIGAVMVTLGPAGAVLVTADGAWHATAPEVPVVSTVGAGDSSVAGYILADVNGGDEAERLSTAMAYGSAAASLPGTTLPTPADLPAQAAVVTRLS